MHVLTIARLTHSPCTAVRAATADATQLSTMNKCNVDYVRAISAYIKCKHVQHTMVATGRKGLGGYAELR